MGLKNLTVLYNSKSFAHLAPYKKEGWLSSFAGKRLCIDAHHWMYSHMATSQKELLRGMDLAVDTVNRNEIVKKWMETALRYSIEYLENKITPVFVFDGVSVPEKFNTQEKRREIRQKAMEEIDEMEKLKEEFDILSIPPHLLQNLKDKYNQCVSVSHDEVDMMYNFLKMCGIPVVRASGEAEQLCSILCIEGICSAVVSSDTDCFAFGSPLTITKLERKRYNSERGCMDRPITYVVLSDLCRSIGLNHSSFVEFAILSGCDFNMTIPKWGAVKCYNIILKYGNIDNIPPEEFKDDINKIRDEILLVTKCREIFRIVGMNDRMNEGYFDLRKVDSFVLRDVFEQNNFISLFEYFISLSSGCSPANNRGYIIYPPTTVPHELKVI